GGPRPGRFDRHGEHPRTAPSEYRHGKSEAFVEHIACPKGWLGRLSKYFADTKPAPRFCRAAGTAGFEEYRVIGIASLDAPSKPIEASMRFAGFVFAETQLPDAASGKLFL